MYVLVTETLQHLRARVLYVPAQYPTHSVPCHARGLPSSRHNALAPFSASLVGSRPRGVLVARVLFLDVEFLHVRKGVKSQTHTPCAYIALHI